MMPELPIDLYLVQNPAAHCPTRLATLHSWPVSIQLLVLDTSYYMLPASHSRLVLLASLFRLFWNGSPDILHQAHGTNHVPNRKILWLTLLLLLQAVLRVKMKMPIYWVTHNR